jgi:hypothetical protein
MGTRLFPEHPPRPPVHACQIYRSEPERRSALHAFIERGLREGERTVCFSARPCDQILDAFLGREGLSLQAAQASGQLTLGTSRDWLVAAGTFEPERIFQAWRDLYQDSEERGFPGIRAIGEMLPELECLRGGLAISLYESWFNGVFQRCPPTCVVCQYDARAFNGWTLMGVLKAHPLVLVDGRIRTNPFYGPEIRSASH